MITNHTPAPWEITRHATPDYAPQYGIYAGAESRDIVTVKGGNAKADAQLIAAAPELLDALDDCRGVLQSIDNQLQGKSIAVRATLEKAIAAITKATQNPA